jgi:hypothetical protein
MNTCKDFSLPLCGNCLFDKEERSNVCAIINWKHNIGNSNSFSFWAHKYPDNLMLTLMDWHSKLTTKTWFLFALELYYPELFKEFNKLLILL